VAVGYSASPLILGTATWLLWRTPMSGHYLLGGLLGLCGVLLIFAPELAGLGARPGAATGAAFTLGAVALSTVGSLVSSRNAQAGLPFWPALGWGMVWSAVCSAGVALALGQRLAGPLPLGWWLSLGYLAVAGSVVAFACYLALQQRLGPGPASSVGVATPVLALLVSATLEGWQPTLPALAGVVLALAGNALTLGWGRRESALAAPGPRT
jgi:drug/metabolite transporter (DMT)-like permease